MSNQVNEQNKDLAMNEAVEPEKEVKDKKEKKEKTPRVPKARYAFTEQGKELQAAMEKHGLTTLVPFSKVLECKPQVLYSKFNGTHPETKEKIASFDNLANSLKNKLGVKNFEELCVAAVEKMQVLNKAKEEKRAERKAAKKAEKANNKKKKELAPGVAIEYDTYRTENNEKKVYTAKGVITKVTEEFVYFDKDNGQACCLPTDKAVKNIRIIEETKEEKDVKAETAEAK